MQKSKEEMCKSGFASLDTYIGGQQNDETLKNQSAVEDSVTTQINMLFKVVEQLKKDVDSFKKMSGKGHYRKNKRVCYIPKKPLFEKVLTALRKNKDEPLKETIPKVFAAAAKNLGLSDRNE